MDLRQYIFFMMLIASHCILSETKPDFWENLTKGIREGSDTVEALLKFKDNLNKLKKEFNSWGVSFSDAKTAFNHLSFVCQVKAVAQCIQYLGVEKDEEKSKEELPPFRSCLVSIFSSILN
ncbi:hypothetical protein QAD02_009527 [Eretmocerus hayati]|uniref:Uncharacterized protein n=1 Tax=Eretmocerus hayati TaxID=131215 RepID=A0ACC2NC36_9HYME|nr:hypothetical protein QAD02_009527 [Eretmocerus hayati]